MDQQEQVGALVAELGTTDADIEGILQLGEDEWLVRYLDFDVTLELDEPSSRLTLSAPLDAPEPERRLAVYEALLSYALLWRDTGGVFTALTREGEAVLLVTLHAPGLTRESLAAIFLNFVAKARVLRTFIARREPASADAPHETDLTNLMMTGIRI